jgi:dihydrofolate synthase / folylpolyglutamate synthase
MGQQKWLFVKTKTMQLIPIKTKILHPPHDDLWEAFITSSLALQDGDILVVASKVVAIGEGRCVEKLSLEQKDSLTKQEADWYLTRDQVPGEVVMHALVDGQLAVSAGIDPFGGYYVLWPERPMESASVLRDRLKEYFGLSTLGVIVSDSKSTPLRRGVVGGAIGWAGFSPLYDNRSRLDLTGEKSGGSQINVADAVAAAAVLVMGEGTEQTPLVIARNVPYAFLSSEARKETNTSYVVPPEEDIFAPFITTALWQKGGREGTP